MNENTLSAATEDGGTSKMSLAQVGIWFWSFFHHDSVSTSGNTSSAAAR